MPHTGVEWVVAPDGTRGHSWNYFTGCLNGCEYCYARRLACGRLRTRYLNNQNVLAGDPEDPFAPRVWPERLEWPYQLKKPTMIFPCDMGEWCGPWLPREDIEDMLDVVRDCYQHTFAFLTKQPQEVPSWTPLPENAWLGFTITDDGQARRVLEAIAAINAAAAPRTTRPCGLLFASFEPLHDPIDPMLLRQLSQVLDWAIVGAQTKPRRDPQPATVSTVVTHFDNFNKPVFLKDNIAHVAAAWMMEEYRRIPARGGW